MVLKQQAPVIGVLPPALLVMCACRLQRQTVQAPASVESGACFCPSTKHGSVKGAGGHLTQNLVLLQARGRRDVRGADAQRGPREHAQARPALLQLARPHPRQREPSLHPPPLSRPFHDSRGDLACMSGGRLDCAVQKDAVQHSTMLNTMQFYYYYCYIILYIL